MRSYLRITGEILISLGVLILGFMAYMYWGTAVREGTAQRTFVVSAFSHSIETNFLVAVPFVVLGFVLS